MTKSRRLTAIVGLILICAVVGHKIKFVSLDGAVFVVGVALVVFAMSERKLDKV
jgi:hypothetical protein